MEPLLNPSDQKSKKRISYAVYGCSSRFDKDLELIFHQCSNLTFYCRCVDKHDALTLVTLLLLLSSSIIPHPKNNFLTKFFLRD